MKKLYSKNMKLQPQCSFTDQQLHEQINAVAAAHNFLLSDLEPGYTDNLVSFARTSNFKTPQCLTKFIERALRSAPVKQTV